MRFLDLIALGLLAALPPAPPRVHAATDAPRYTPRAGVEIARTFEANGTRELRTMVIQVGDREQAIQDVETTFSLAAKYVIVDHYLEVSGGRVLRLQRAFRELSRMNTETRAAHGPEDPPRKTPETCGLEGETVVFTWDTEKQVYIPKLASGDRAEAALAKLNFDMDCTRLLPPPGTAEGVKWRLAIADVKTALLRPTGYLPFKPKSPTDPMDLRLRDAAWDGTTGRLDLEWRVRSEPDGAQLAAITFEGTIEIDATVERQGETSGPDKLGTRSSEKIQGELVWDVARGGPRAIQWSSKGTAKVRITGKQPTQSGTPIEMVQILSFDQEYAFKGTYEVR